MTGALKNLSGILLCREQKSAHACTLDTDTQWCSIPVSVRNQKHSTSQSLV